MQLEIVIVYRDGRVLELDDYFYAFALGSGGEVQERMLVEAWVGRVFRITGAAKIETVRCEPSETASAIAVFARQRAFVRE